MGTPRGSCWGQNLKLLNFDPKRQVRGVFALCLGADFNRGVKTLIFDLFWGSGAVFGAPGGTPGGQKCKMLNFEPGRHVRGVFASFLGADFNRGVKIMIFGLLGGSGAVFGPPRGRCGGQKLKNAQF